MKNWIVRQMLKKKLKGMVPDAQIDMVIEMFLENPDFFQNMEKEIKENTKKGMDQQAAAMLVMRKHQADMQKMFKASQEKK